MFRQSFGIVSLSIGATSLFLLQRSSTLTKPCRYACSGSCLLIVCNYFFGAERFRQFGSRTMFRPWSLPFCGVSNFVKPLLSFAMAQHHDRYSENDRRLYNRHYYAHHREHLNRKRRSRRAVRMVKNNSERVSLSTEIPREVLEYLASWISDNTDDTITVVSTLTKKQLRRALSSEGEVILRNCLHIREEAQNTSKQSDGA